LKNRLFFVGLHIPRLNLTEVCRFHPLFALPSAESLFLPSAMLGARGVLGVTFARVPVCKIATTVGDNTHHSGSVPWLAFSFLTFTNLTAGRSRFA
jgi:hypothetical protein